MGATVDDLKDVYVKQVRSVLELAVPPWNGDLKHYDKQNIDVLVFLFLKSPKIMYTIK